MPIVAMIATETRASEQEERPGSRPSFLRGRSGTATPQLLGRARTPTVSARVSFSDEKHAPCHLSKNSIAILALALGTAHAAERIVEGRVVGVSDGDTVTSSTTRKPSTRFGLPGSTLPKRPGVRRTLEAKPICARVPEASRGALPQEGPLRPRGVCRVRQPP